MYLCVYIHGWAYLYQGMREPEDNLQEFVLSSHMSNPGLKLRSWVAKLDSQCLCILSHFINSWF